MTEMANDPLPVTPALINWARKRAGFSLDEAAADFKKIESWETGQSSPTYPQLERMAEKFKVPVAVFFFPEPPVLLQFGAFVRRERKAREIGLRKMAKMIGVSPTYLSKVERDEFTPPTEDKVRAIAQIIECNTDILLAMAGRVASDLAAIIRRNPVEVAALLRAVSDMPRDEIARLVEGASRMEQA